MNDVVRQRAVQDGGGVEFLACDGRPDDGEDARANNRADTEAGERPRAQRLFQPVFGLLRFGDQLVNGLAREELVRQGNAPGGMSPLDSNRNSGATASQNGVHHEDTENMEFSESFFIFSVLSVSPW